MEKWFKVGAVAFLISLLLRPLTTDNLADPDLWGYLAFGRLFWHNQAFPYKDVFSYVPTLPWVYHEWLTGVLFFPLSQIAGGTVLQLLKYCLGLGTAGLIYLTARKRGARPVAAVVFLLIVFIPLAHNSYSPVRAQVFTFFFFALSVSVP